MRYRNLEEKIDEMLREYDREADGIGKSDLEVVTYLIKAKKSLEEIKMLEYAGYSNGDGRGNSMRGGNSYGYDGEDSYRRGRGADGRYISRNSYGDGALEHKLDEMIRSAREDETKNVLREIKRMLDD